MPYPLHIEPAIIEEIILAYSMGMPRAQLLQKYNISKSTLLWHLRTHGIPRRPNGRPKTATLAQRTLTLPPRPVRLPPEQRALSPLQRQGPPKRSNAPVMSQTAVKPWVNKGDGIGPTPEQLALARAEQTRALEADAARIAAYQVEQAAWIKPADVLIGSRGKDWELVTDPRLIKSFGHALVPTEDDVRYDLVDAIDRQRGCCANRHCKKVLTAGQAHCVYIEGGRVKEVLCTPCFGMTELHKR